MTLTVILCAKWLSVSFPVTFVMQTVTFCDLTMTYNNTCPPKESCLPTYSDSLWFSQWLYLPSQWHVCSHHDRLGPSNDSMWPLHWNCVHHHGILCPHNGCSRSSSVDQIILELRNQLSSASLVLVLKTCATTPSCMIYINHGFLTQGFPDLSILPHK